MTIITEVQAPTLLPFIGGERRRSHAVSSFDLVNPATEDVFASVPDGDADDVDAAVDAATSAQRVWARMAPSERGNILHRWGALIADRMQELAELDTRDMGKPITDTRADVGGVVKMINHWAGKADKISGQQLPVTPGHLSYTAREAIGVCGVIVPWNGPTANIGSRVAPAIACGNAVVIKPSEFSPSSAGVLAELSVVAGMPAGLVNVVLGSGASGALITTHPGVGAVSFTGSVGTGQRIATAAAPSFKSLVLEMGGKSPNVVFEDANIEAALRGSVWGIFYNSGQVCCAGTRLLVQESIAEQFVDELIRRTSNLIIGDPMDPQTNIGPVVCAKQRDRVMSYIDIGKAEGARLMTGGSRPDSVGERGLYVAPTVFAEARPDMRIAAEEIFGPVLTVLTFRTEEEALALANGVEYGLSATIWTSDVGKMLRFADRLDSGTIWGNTMRVHDPALPFGGFKSSGLGNAYADEAVSALTRIKRVTIRFDDDARTPGWA